MNYTTDFKSIRAEVSAGEWQARVDLAACYRLVDKYGMTDAPGALHLHGRRRGQPARSEKAQSGCGGRAPFVNTSVRFLNGFDYLYDAEGGFVGLRWTGRVPQSFGRVVSPSN